MMNIYDDDSTYKHYPTASLWLIENGEYTELLVVCKLLGYELLNEILKMPLS